MKRHNRDFENRNNRQDLHFENPERLGMSHGNNSRRGNYTIDSHFNAEDGAYGNEDYDNQTGFNTNADASNMYPHGRFRSGGAVYSGGDYTGSNYNENNPYGVNYVDHTGYNSGRHYDRNVNYDNSDYNSGREAGRSNRDYSGYNRDFGHEVNYENSPGMRSPYQNDFDSERRYNRPHHRHDDRGPHRSNASRMQHSYGPSDAYRHSPDLRNENYYENEYTPRDRRRGNDYYNR